ncbi:RHS domain-containing protein [Burkholderia sp. LA-2-3-30-S1-D2]|nr:MULTISPECIES: RHS domain-containing protein [Burkholderia]
MSLPCLSYAAGAGEGGGRVERRRWRRAVLASIAYYHCDQIGTPQELTDEAGEIAWSARYRAWGDANEVIVSLPRASSRLRVPT